MFGPLSQRGSRRTEAAPWVPIRWPVTVPATIHEIGTCALDVTVTDLSVVACRLYAGFRLREGYAAKLCLPGLAPIRGRIAWSRDWYAAVDFDTALHPSVVRHLVKTHRPAGTMPRP